MYKIIRPPKGGIVAKHAFVTRQEDILSAVCEEYGRDKATTCIKVFYSNPLSENEPLVNALWGDDPLRQDDPRKNTTVFAGSQVQNILWRHNISPRVYAIFEAELEGRRVACQLTDFVEGGYPEMIEVCYKIKKEIDNLGVDYGFASQTDKFSLKDVVGGKCVDPQLWAFDKKPYKEVVEQIYYEKGKYGKIYYQNDDELGFHGGPRHSEDRIKYMKLDEIDFTGKVVWDIGCAEGFFCRYAYKRGAKRVIGFDLKDQLEAAFHAGNFLGHFNIDYVEADLSRGIPAGLPKPDITFFLSLNYHIGIPEYLKDISFLIFEDNGKESREREVLDKPWIDWFNNIKFVGRALDHGNKPVYWLRKEN